MNSDGEHKELEFHLVCQGDITEEWERNKINDWNSKTHNKKVLKTMGFCDNYRGEIYIFMEDGRKIEYSYNMDPRGIRTDVHSVKINEKVVSNYHGENSIMRFVEDYGSLCIGAVRFTEEFPDYSWIKVKRFKEEDYPSLEEKYEALKLHHEEEVNFLINHIKRKENECFSSRTGGKTNP